MIPCSSQVSMFMLPKKESDDNTDGLEGGLMHLEFTDLAFPDPPGIITGHRSTDLESVARIPGTNLVLLCESGNSADKACNATRADRDHGLPDPTWRYDATANKTDPTFCETPPPRIYVSEVRCRTVEVGRGLGYRGQRWRRRRRRRRGRT